MVDVNCCDVIVYVFNGRHSGERGERILAIKWGLSMSLRAISHKVILAGLFEIKVLGNGATRKLPRNTGKIAKNDEITK